MNLKLSVFFLTKLKKTELGNFVFHIVAFDSIEFQICLDPQNDKQNISFVKDVHVVDKKMTKNKQYQIIIKKSTSKGHTNIKNGTLLRLISTWQSMEYIYCCKLSKF